jgi:restriction endonuclease S subunit
MPVALRSMTTVGAILKGIVAGKSVQTLDRPAVGNELAILKVSAVTWGEFRPQESKAMPANYNPGDCPRAMDGDILISRANTRELVGAPVMVRGDHPQLLLSDKLLKLIPDEDTVDRKYLVRALRAPAAASHFAKCAGGTSGSMTNITQDNIRSAPIFLPPISQQRRIAAILDQADALRAQRRHALAELDRLAQAVFVEMFGDPVSGSNRWPTSALSDVCSTINDCPHSTPDWTNDGVVCLRTSNLKVGDWDWTDKLLIIIDVPIDQSPGNQYCQDSCVVW